MARRILDREGDRKPAARPGRAPAPRGLHVAQAVLEGGSQALIAPLECTGPRMAQPDLGGINSVPVHPVRQVFMMGAVWRLAQDRGGSFLNVLEVGSWVGVSALTFGKALAYHNGGKGHITCVDAWSPYVDLAANDSPMYVEVNGALRSGRIFDAF